MTTFNNLDIGEVFRTNLMYFQKMEPEERTDHDNDRRIRVNARFLSDDHYEAKKTDIYKGGAPVWVDEMREVKPVDGGSLRAVQEEKTTLRQTG